MMQNGSTRKTKLNFSWIWKFWRANVLIQKRDRCSKMANSMRMPLQTWSVTCLTDLTTKIWLRVESQKNWVTGIIVPMHFSFGLEIPRLPKWRSSINCKIKGQINDEPFRRLKVPNFCFMQLNCQASIWVRMLARICHGYVGGGVRTT